MEIKRVHIAYFSPTGTTKRTLRAVAEGFGCSELSETDWGDPKSRAAILKTGPDELVIAGMPVYYGRIPSLFHEGLPLRGEGTPFVPVAVYGNRHYDDAVLELKTLGEAAGCVTLGAAAFVAQHCLNPDMGRGRPDASDLAVMKRFGSALRAKADGLAGSMPPLSVPGAVPYKEYKPTPFAPELLDAETCIRCGLCARTCRVRIIDSETYAVTEPERCLFCFGCVRICPVAVRGPRPGVAPVFAAQMAGLAARCTERREPELFL